MHRTRTMALWMLLVAFAALAWGAPEKEEPPKLLGKITVGQLQEEPYSEWFQKGYDDYVPSAAIIRELQEVDRSGVEITAFFGTWCPDSRREVPRLVKVLDAAAFPVERRTLVAIDNTEEATKRSPGGEEAGVEVYRVPTVVVSRGGREVARFVEHPVLSTERDLLTILSGQPYEANYTSYPIVRRWLRDGLLADPNVSPDGLAAQVRNEVRMSGELVAAARVLLSRGEAVEAVKLLQVNASLYPDDAGTYAWLAKGQAQIGELDEAWESVERAVELDEEPGAAKRLLQLIDEIGAKRRAAGIDGKSEE